MIKSAWQNQIYENNSTEFSCECPPCSGPKDIIGERTSMRMNKSPAKRLGMETDMTFDECTDEKVTVIVARAHVELHGVIR
jgi:hypothetical protein